MKKHILFLAISIFFCTTTTAQTGKHSFRDYANAQDSMQMAAYRARDTKTFEKLIKQFNMAYGKLGENDKQEYANYLQNGYYNLCCTYSLIGNKTASVAHFKNAMNAGYYDYAHVQEDKDLDNIRQEPAFIELLGRMQEIGDYQYILTKAKEYNLQDKRPFPKFTYQSKDDTNLVALRKGFNLDSIAGAGNEVSKIINLMHWIHNYIPHDGNHPNPRVYSAEKMIAVCRQEKRGLNCRGLVTVLNECYLAMGFPSRLVTCMPKDSLGVDQDCHVINLVYAKSLKKWVWMDPTNDAYIMNEKGELLDISEVRERVINKETLIINPDANWNHRSSTIKVNYLDYYMAKNLYRFECPVNSVSNLEARAKGKRLEYVVLLPLDYFEQKADKTEDGDPEKGTVFVRYRTNNPDLFWELP